MDFLSIETIQILISIYGIEIGKRDIKYNFNGVELKIQVSNKINEQCLIDSIVQLSSVNIGTTTL
jgi:hypothetical protein